mgnify:CR=1 FL=1
MNKARFDRAFQSFINNDDEQVTANTFFETLAEIERERAEKVIELQAHLVGDQLEFIPSPDVAVNGNEIVLGNQRIVVRMA